MEISEEGIKEVYTIGVIEKSTTSPPSGYSSFKIRRKLKLFIRCIPRFSEAGSASSEMRWLK